MAQVKRHKQMAILYNICATHEPTKMLINYRENILEITLIKSYSLKGILILQQNFKVYSKNTIIMLLKFFT